MSSTLACRPGFLYIHGAVHTRTTTVILDFGGVVGLPQDPARVAAMASLCRLSREEFLAAYRPDRLELDRGSLSPDDYWAKILARGGVAPTKDIVARLEREDALGWTRANWSVVTWVSELRGAGYRTAILSNMPPDKLSFIRASEEYAWIRELDGAFFSCDYRLVKPEPQFYRLCLARLGVSPGECVFLDDSETNAEAARAMGINAVVYRSDRQAAEEVSRVWGLPARSLFDGTGT